MATENMPDAERRPRKRKKETLIRAEKELDDARLCEHSRTWRGIFVERLAEFSAYDPTLNAAFAADWLAKIEDFEGHPTDETMRDEVDQKTQNVQKELEKTMKIVNGFEYFARTAFPNDERIISEFGFEKFVKVQANHISHVALLSYTLVLVAADYAAELATAGMPATLPGDLNSQKDALAEAETLQEYTKRLRLRMTTQRIKKFNALYALHVRVHAAAKNIFDAVGAKEFE
jgi:hypothetical protein